MTRKKRGRKIAGGWGGIGEILDGLLRRSGVGARVQEQKALDLWGEVVGEAIADKTRPLHLRNGMLLVAVGSSVWMQELHFLKGRIVEKLKGKLEAKGIFLQDVRFCIGDVSVGEKPVEKKEKEEATVHPIGEWEKQKITEAVAEVADPEMREILARLFIRGVAVPKKPEA